MALHFSISINMVPIGHVAIRRLNRKLISEQPSQYAVEVAMNDSLRIETTVEHHYADGALSLISKALATADQIRKERNGHGS